MTFLQLGKEVIGLNLHLGEQDTTYRYVLMKKKGNELMLVKWMNARSIEEINLLKDHPHINLLITGKGVVHKQDEEANQKSYDPQKIVVQRNNNLSIDLFRKDKLNEILETLSKKSIVPECIYLGESTVDHHEELGILNSIVADNVSFGDEQYPVEIKNALSAALMAFVSKDLISTVVLDGSVGKKHENILFKHRLFQGLKLAVLVVLLFLLVGGTLNLMLNHRQSKLQANLVDNRPQMLQLQRINKELEGKQKLLEQNNWIRSSKMSFYLDRIARDIPNGVVLNKWAFFTEKTNGIVVEGSANESSDFNTWILKLKATEFIDKRSISFEYDEITALDESKGLFTLMFDINE